MRKDSNAGQRTHRQPTPTKIIVERHYVGTEKMETVFKRIAADYLEVAERLARQEIDMLEINISCPNVEHGRIAFGQEPGMVEYITKEIKKKAVQPVSMKLTPNVTDITEIAKAAETGGADALSLINTITGMRIDVKKRASQISRRGRTGQTSPFLGRSGSREMRLRCSNVTNIIHFKGVYLYEYQNE